MYEGMGQINCLLTNLINLNDKKLFMGEQIDFNLKIECLCSQIKEQNNEFPPFFVWSFL